MSTFVYAEPEKMEMEPPHPSFYPPPKGLL